MRGRASAERFGRRPRCPIAAKHDDYIGLECFPATGRKIADVLAHSQSLGAALSQDAEQFVSRSFADAAAASFTRTKARIAEAAGGQGGVVSADKIAPILAATPGAPAWFPIFARHAKLPLRRAQSSEIKPLSGFRAAGPAWLLHSHPFEGAFAASDDQWCAGV